MDKAIEQLLKKWKTKIPTVSVQQCIQDLKQLLKQARQDQKYTSKESKNNIVTDSK